MDKTTDYNLLNSKVPNFARIKRDFSQAEVLNLNYRIKETSHHQMVQNFILPVVMNNQIYFCFDMIDTIYSYNLKTNSLKKHFGFSTLSFSPIFFNGDTCKDIELSRYNLFEQSSSIVELLQDEKNNYLIRVIRYYDKENDEKKVYLQIFDASIKLLKVLFVPDKYSPHLIKTTNGSIYLLENKKNKTHVYKRICLDKL